jgi:hypothetical protein
MNIIDNIVVVLGGPEHAAEAREIVDEAFDVWRWRERPYQYPERLALLMAEQRVKDRTKVGLLRRWRF